MINNDCNILKLAGQEVCRTDNNLYANYEHIEITIPDRLNIKIRKLITNHFKKIRLKNTIIKIASIVIAGLIISGTVLSVNVEAREKLMRLLRKKIGSSIFYSPSNDSIEDSLQIVLNYVNINWLPEGFSLKKEYHNDNSITYLYKSLDSSIHIKCAIIKNYTDIGYYSADETGIKNEIGFYNELYYEFIYADDYSKTNNLIVINDIEKYYIQIDSSLAKETIFKIYDNIELQYTIQDSGQH